MLTRKSTVSLSYSNSLRAVLRFAILLSAQSSFCRLTDVQLNVLQVTDSDPIIQALKTCLRTSNQHLQTATLSAIPPFLSLILSHTLSRPMPTSGPASSTASTSSAGSSSIDTPTLRQILTTFLPPPGIIERLSDAKEKNREKARESLVMLGGFAFRGGSSSLTKSGSGKGQEPPMLIFERYLKESGLGSKVWRVREQVRSY